MEMHLSQVLTSAGTESRTRGVGREGQSTAQGEEDADMIARSLRPAADTPF